MTVAWEELGDDERTALMRMNRGPYAALPQPLADRLIALGLAEQRPNGVGINRTGRELVIGRLLETRER